MAQSQVERIGLGHAQGNIRSGVGQQSGQKRVGGHQLQRHAHPRLRGEPIVYQLPENLGLIPARGHPNRQDGVGFRAQAADGGIVVEEGGEELFKIMLERAEEAGLPFGQGHPGRADEQPVDGQRLLSHGVAPGGQGGDVVPIHPQPLGDLGGICRHAVHLGVQPPDGVRPLVAGEAGCADACFQRLQARGGRLHVLERIRNQDVELIVSIDIGFASGDHDDLAVETVQLVGTGIGLR